jgi:alpha-N-arabinofuranosidase
VQQVATVSVKAGDAIKLKITAQGRNYSFFYATDERNWQSLVANDDGSILSTEVAGGFVGATVGPYARVEQ